MFGLGGFGVIHPATSTVTTGGTISLSSYVTNSGASAAGANYTRYWLSNDTTLDSSDTFIDYQYVSPLSAGSSQYNSYNFTYNSSWGTGTKYVLFQADSTNLVSESNESNNLAYATIVVNPNSNTGVPTTYQPFNASQVFSLNSNSGANHTIYLDFDGHTTTGTAWNNSYGSTITTPAYDTDGNTSSFSTAELENIWNIWRRVAEDFIPFNVNVTTASPSPSDLIKSDNRVSINRYLSGGKYYLRLMGTGKGDLITGYSNYGSLGQYSITGTLR
ncbi:CARDB domain-containing protein [Limnofasciculus baicalensis]|uniref:CARDB domain-containing protein n=1 Tax=Limnofasciculus baicalensis BBK-W-15 TaxID=2699891 RepID=A0AAE3GP00_9CYAN|nr:CARDB domain-containing protein [Limnofasciculus baicalensis]MCP2727356.1 hypothetical protein [Limnofasciculus baicalensis BBK-W-15]